MMFRADKAALAATLAAIDAVVKPKNAIPLLQHVVFERRDKMLIVRGSDLDHEMIGELSVEFGEDFYVFTCKSRAALEFVRAAPATEVTVNSTGQDHKSVTFSSGRARIRLPVLLGDDFPRLAATADAFEFHISGAPLSSAISAVAYAANTGIDRPNICGVLLEGADEGMSVVATDGKQMERRLLPAALFSEEIDIQQIPRVTLPTESALRIAKLTSDADRCNLSIASNRMAVRVGQVTFVTKLMEDPFPTIWRSLIPTGADIVATMDKADFEAALSRVMIANGKDIDGVWLVMTPGSLSLQTRGQDGDARDQIECDFAGTISVSVNGRQILDAMGKGKVTSRRVEIALTTPEQAITLRPEDDHDNLFIAMPYRVIWSPEA